MPWGNLGFSTELSLLTLWLKVVNLKRQEKKLKWPQSAGELRQQLSKAARGEHNNEVEVGTAVRDMLVLF